MEPLLDQLVCPIPSPTPIFSMYLLVKWEPLSCFWQGNVEPKMVQFPCFINSARNHSEGLFGSCLLAGTPVEGALGNPTRAASSMWAQNAQGLIWMSCHVTVSPTERAEGSSYASLLHLQGGHLGLVGHLSSDRGGTQQNRNMGYLHAGTHWELGDAWAHSPQRSWGAVVAVCGHLYGCA